jgi:hypothetical protein
MPVHQPSDHEDDQDQSEYAADPDGPALTVIAAAVVPNPPPKRTTSSRMIRTSSIGLSFISFVGNPRRAAAGSFPLGPMKRVVERRPSQEVSGYTLGPRASTYNEG